MSSLSLRRRLLRTLMLPIISGIMLAGVWSYFAAFHEAGEMYDGAQVHFARVLHTLAQQVTKAETIPVEEVPKRGGAYEKYLTFRVWKDGRLLVQSDNAENFGPITREQGFTDREIDGTPWRFYVEHQGRISVEVAEETKVRFDLVRHILWGTFSPQLISIPVVVALIIWFSIAWSIRPVDRLSQLVRTRHVNQLTPLSSDGVPRELRAIVDAINDLMQRVGDAMRVEKNFTSYAAHEMRTPIAALKTQAQVILRTREPERQKELARDLLETVSRTQHIIEQLLTYARVQNDAVELAAIPLDTLVLDEVRFAIPRALEKQITIDTEIPPAQAMAQPALLRLVLSNLLDNAIKYIAPGGRIALTWQEEPETLLLTLRDDGPGVTAEQLPHIFDPFFRVTGAAAAGAGLGLAIVRWACEVQHITIDTHDGIGGRGLGFTLRLPRPPHPARG